jgi:lipopolysaccharide transport protein LptA
MFRKPIYCVLVPMLWVLSTQAFAVTAPASSATATTINADRSSALSPPHDNRTRIVYTGHVVIHRGTLTLLGERAVIYIRKQTIERIAVTGQPAKFTFKPRGKPIVRGQAINATYEADNDTLQLDGEVQITRPGESFTAEHVNYGLKTRLLKAHSNDSGQIHAVLTPAGGSLP